MRAARPPRRRAEAPGPGARSDRFVLATCAYTSTCSTNRVHARPPASHGRGLPRRPGDERRLTGRDAGRRGGRRGGRATLTHLAARGTPPREDAARGRVQAGRLTGGRRMLLAVALAMTTSSVAILPDGLLQHFQDREILLRREARYGGRKTEWIVENADVGPRCEVVTSFVGFPRGTGVAAMRQHLRGISVPSVLHERERLAMFHPHARSKTSDRADCRNWPAKSGEIVGRLLEAFKSYQRVHAGTSSGANR